MEPKKRRQIASEFIWLFLNEKHRRSLELVNDILSNTKSEMYIMFKILDKIDPIIAIWRYLHHYRGKLGPDPKQFNHDMKDFFENPDVKNFYNVNKVEDSLMQLVLFLQNRSNAWDYYQDPDRVFKNAQLFSFPKEVIRKAIEGIPLFTM